MGYIQSHFRTKCTFLFWINVMKRIIFSLHSTFNCTIVWKTMNDSIRRALHRQRSPAIELNESFNNSSTTTSNNHLPNVFECASSIKLFKMYRNCVLTMPLKFIKNVNVKNGFIDWPGQMHQRFELPNHYSWTEFSLAWKNVK